MTIRGNFLRFRATAIERIGEGEMIQPWVLEGRNMCVCVCERERERERDRETETDRHR